MQILANNITNIAKMRLLSKHMQQIWECNGAGRGRERKTGDEARRVAGSQFTWLSRPWEVFELHSELDSKPSDCQSCRLLGAQR